ncbi:MAG TPA: hypothetical protein VJV39_06400 [Dongiaceae bacterium]|nr:hypothetical protein [Dongiaceae bacterium]
MPNWIEFRLAVQGLLRLARFNSDFPRFFDRSASGALRSFWLMVPLYPFYLLQLWAVGAAALPQDTTQFLFAMSVGYLNLWLVPPMLIATIAPMVGRDAEMPGCITVYNWQSVLNICVALPLILLDLGGVSADVTAILYNVLVLVTLAWETYVLTHTLRIRLWQAALAAVADHFITNWVLLSIFLALGGVR